MTLTLNLNDLGSRAIRQAAAGASGVRRIAINATSNPEDEEEGGALGIYNAANKFGRGLMQGTLSALGNFALFSWNKFWGFCVQSYFFLMNFNWNATDAQLDAQIKQAEIGLAAARGRLAGQSLGYAICGIIPTATIAVFNEPLALYIMKELGEEAAEEISASLASLINLTIRQQARSAFINLFKNHRTLLRDAATATAQILVNTGIITQDSLDKMYIKSNEPWTFAGALDESVESIKDPAEQAYAEEFYDELQEACIEAGYIVASGADSYFAQQKMANESFFGKEKIIEITPNRSVDVDEENTTP